MMPSHSADSIALEPNRPSHRTVVIQRHLLAKNREQAEQNRQIFRERRIGVINMLSSPGSGKTTLLERTLEDYQGRQGMAVIVGDLQTENDARRMAGATGQRNNPIVAVTTGTICHLEAEMVSLAMQHIPLDQVRLLVIENVGNLVCPAAFDLGESRRVVLLSTTEGEDKPLKYPKAFNSADLIVITKSDLAAATEFDEELARKNCHSVAPMAPILTLSARTRVGLDAWYAFLDVLASVPDDVLDGVSVDPPVDPPVAF